MFKQSIYMRMITLIVTISYMSVNVNDCAATDSIVTQTLSSHINDIEPSELSRNSQSYAADGGENTLFYTVLLAVGRGQEIKQRIKALHNATVLPDKVGMAMYVERALQKVDPTFSVRAIIVRDSYLWSNDPADVDVYVVVDTDKELAHCDIASDLSLDLRPQIEVVLENGVKKKLELDLWIVAENNINDTQRAWIYKRGVVLYGDGAEYLSGPRRKGSNENGIYFAWSAHQILKQADVLINEGNYRKSFHRMILAYRYLDVLEGRGSEDIQGPARLLKRIQEHFSVTEKDTFGKISGDEAQREYLAVLKRYESVVNKRDQRIIDLVAWFLEEWRDGESMNPNYWAAMKEGIKERVLYDVQDLEIARIMIKNRLTIFPVERSKIDLIDKMFDGSAKEITMHITIGLERSA